MPEQRERDEMITAIGGTAEGGTAAAFADLRARGFSLLESMYIVTRAFGISVDAAAEAVSASGVWDDLAHHVERGKGIVTSSERAGAARALLGTPTQRTGLLGRTLSNPRLRRSKA
jgi:hypothetical protein